jgi:hypothetical protein
MKNILADKLEVFIYISWAVVGNGVYGLSLGVAVAINSSARGRVDLFIREHYLVP